MRGSQSTASQPSQENEIGIDLCTADLYLNDEPVPWNPFRTRNSFLHTVW